MRIHLMLISLATGDILIFMTGQDDIEVTCESADGIVVATNIAKMSLKVYGIMFVINENMLNSLFQLSTLSALEETEA
ncbi:hypothetical protein DAPPUDRAFT_263649 [Daphnia pulex]|uniref:Helicase C-terminal domain-containing protein n=1 Tax=Daphnia pulex TaxID=6669 RepID=E9HQ63_DAPPU|nr:hypothetical protein DAPPUDRAFT_263649 [Daphnia pulex]|eukprot:EFX66123.1 hypothetical protein DAPPUDRAFT_263649 [Daphnia pulex]